MFCAATRPRLLSAHRSAPIAPRWSRLSGCKNAHRDLAGSYSAASGPTRSQVSIASGENSRCCTKARRTPLLPQGKPPCVSTGVRVLQGVIGGTGFAGNILDFTGGNSNQSFVDDVVNNFVDTNDSVASTLTKTAVSLAGGGTAAAGYYGTTPLQAANMAWSAYNSAVRIPGLIGSATPLQLVSTAAATWAINSVLIKGSYGAGVLFGSILRTGANRVAAWSCSKP
jgi:hypothetical protein